MTQSIADVAIVRRLPPTVFWPRPKVDSAIVLIRPNSVKRERVGDVTALPSFLRDLYVHRRKNLRGVGELAECEFQQGRGGREAGGVGD